MRTEGRARRCGRRPLLPLWEKVDRRAAPRRMRGAGRRARFQNSRSRCAWRLSASAAFLPAPLIRLRFAQAPSPTRGEGGARPARVQTYPTASDLPHNASCPSRRGRVARRLDAGKGRRLRQRANVARRPGRLRPRVPPPPLGAVCAGRALDGAGDGRKCPDPAPGSGTDGDRNRRTGGRKVADITEMSDPKAARLPDL